MERGRLLINGVRAVENADIILEGITSVEGGNGTGKSTIANFLKRLCVGQKERVKADALADLRALHERATVRLEHDGGVDTFILPENELTTEGTHIKASEVGVGYKNYVDLSVKERFELLSSILEAEPTKEDLKGALESDPDWVALVTVQEQKDAAKEERKVDLSAALDKRVDEAWEIIEPEATKIQDWGRAHAYYEDRRKFLQGQWKERTREKGYQAAKGADWVPQGYKFKQLSEENIAAQEKKIADAEAEFEKLLQDRAVGEKDLKQLEASAKEGPGAQKTLEQLAETIASLEAKLKGRPQDASAPVEPHVFNCHNCNSTNYAYPGEKKGRAQQKPLEKSNADEWDAVANDLNIAIVNKKIAQEMLEKANEAKEILPAIRAKTVTQEQVDIARTKKDDIRKLADAVVVFHRAHEIYTSERIISCLVAVTAPSGLKATKLQEKIKGFNEKLAELSGEDIADWRVEIEGKPSQPAAVRIADDSSVWFGPYPYDALSGGYRLIVNATLQVAIAQLDGTELCVFDNPDGGGAELLQRPMRMGLIYLLYAAGRPCLVTKMTDEEDEVLPLERNEYGRAYFMENGIARIGVPAEIEEEEVEQPAPA